MLSMQYRVFMNIWYQSWCNQLVQGSFHSSVGNIDRNCHVDHPDSVASILTFPLLLSDGSDGSGIVDGGGIVNGSGIERGSMSLAENFKYLQLNDNGVLSIHGDDDVMLWDSTQEYYINGNITTVTVLWHICW